MFFRALVYLLLLGLAAGCTHYNYSPNLVVTPYIVEKNESTLSANLGGFFFVYNVDFQAAYNPLKNVTVMANYFRANNEFTLSGVDYEKQYYRIQYLEGAAGGWLPLFNASCYLGGFFGGGSGGVRNDYGISRLSKLSYSKAFLQPTFIYKGPVFRFGFATRLSKLMYQKGSINSGIPAEDLEKLKRSIGMTARAQAAFGTAPRFWFLRHVERITYFSARIS